MILFLLILLLCLLFPQTAVDGAKEAVTLWAENVLPVLLPFFIISKMLYYLGAADLFARLLRPVLRLLRIPSYAAFPLAMSLLCGYPTGARMVGDMARNGNVDADYLGNVCYSAGPLFMIGSVGTLMLHDTRVGYALAIIHLCALLIFSLFLTPKPMKTKKIESAQSGTLGQAVKESADSIVSVCGFMVLFSLVNRALLLCLPPLPNTVKGLLTGINEFTAGISLLSQTNALPAISFLLSFGGLCVITQCLSFLKGIAKARFILNRFLCGLIACLLCVLYQMFGLSVPIGLTLVTVCTVTLMKRKLNPSFPE
ncbi:MAG: hypothetical protein J6X30_03535 [Clostridia bacterium]|nr:hypothetical protein [Clostridia bacterium]